MNLKFEENLIMTLIRRIFYKHENNDTDHESTSDEVEVKTLKFEINTCTKCSNHIFKDRMLGL